MVAGVFLGEFGMGHEAEGSGAVLDADDDHSAQGEVAPQVAGIVLGLESAAVNPYHDGQSVGSRGGGGGDAEVEAVFAHHVGRAPRSCGLRGHGTELVAHPDAGPWLGGLGCSPAQVAHGRCCIGNGLIDGEGTVGHAFHVAGLYMCSQQWLCAGSRRNECEDQ